jgi:hypothetical protein
MANNKGLSKVTICDLRGVANNNGLFKVAICDLKEMAKYNVIS